MIGLGSVVAVMRTKGGILRRGCGDDGRVVRFVGIRGRVETRPTLGGFILPYSGLV